MGRLAQAQARARCPCCGSRWNGGAGVIKRGRTLGGPAWRRCCGGGGERGLPPLGARPGRERSPWRRREGPDRPQETRSSAFRLRRKLVLCSVCKTCSEGGLGGDQCKELPAAAGTRHSRHRRCACRQLHVGRLPTGCVPQFNLLHLDNKQMYNYICPTEIGVLAGAFEARAVASAAGVR